MTEGHPGFVANNGRIGLGADDYAAYAPETGADVRLHWVAVRRDEAQLSLSDGRTRGASTTLAELGEDVLADFEKRLRTSDSTRSTTSTCPCTRGSGRNRLAITFAPDVARQALVSLGEVAAAAPGAAVDPHVLPGRPPRAVLREGRAGDPEHGLPARALAGLHGARRRRSTTGSPRSWPATRTLAAAGFSVLREHAAIGWTGDVFHRLPVDLGLPQDGRGAVAREPGAPARRRGAAGDDGVACCTATATAGRWSPS